MVDMPLTQRVRSMSNGISTQAPTVRFPSQVEDSTNVNFSILEGAVKRHGSEMQFKLMDAVAQQPYALHLIERDQYEQFMIVYGYGGFLSIVDLINSTNTITLDKTGTFNGYLTSNDPQATDIRFLTVGDTTFVLNRTVTTELADPDTVGGTQYGFKAQSMPHRLVVTGTSAANNVVFTGSPIPWTERNFYEQVIQRPANPPTQGTFRLTFKEEQTEAFLNPGETDADSDDTQYHIPWDAESTNYVSGAEGDGIDQYLEVLNTVGNGKTLCVHGPLKADPIVVEFSRDLRLGDGSPDFPGGTDGHMLSVTNVDLNNTPYFVERGSNDRNPPPGLIKNGYAISDLAYYRGRLILGGRDLIIMSRVDELFNLWIDRPSALGDADPIDLQIASTDVAEIEHITEFHGSLLIMTRQGRQYFLEDVSTLSSTTAAVSPSTKYETLPNVRPITVGENLFMVGRSATFSPIWQYFHDEMSDSSKAIDISKHVRGMLPTTIGNIAGSTGSQTLAVISDAPGLTIPSESFTTIADGDWDSHLVWATTAGLVPLDSGDITPQPQDETIIRNDVEMTGGYEPEPGTAATETAYIYTFRWWDEGRERVQAAWAKWEYGAESLLDCMSVDDQLYVLRRDDACKGGPALFIDVVGLGDEAGAQSGMPYAIRLDQQIRGGTINCPASIGTYGGHNFTRWLLRVNGATSADEFFGHNIDSAVLGSGFESAYQGEMLVLESDRSTLAGLEYVYAYANAQPDSVAGLAGDYSRYEVMLGRRFDAEVELSRVFFRGSDNNPLLQGRLRLTKLLVDTVNSGDYQVIIKTDNTAQPDRTHDVTHDGFPEYATSLTHVTANAEGTQVFLKAIDAQPVSWASIEWHGLYSTNIR